MDVCIGEAASDTATTGRVSAGVFTACAAHAGAADGGGARLSAPVAVDSARAAVAAAATTEWATAEPMAAAAAALEAAAAALDAASARLQTR